MLPIPSALRIEFEACMHSRGVPKAEQFAYEKWLRFYLDFCVKYHLPDEYGECPTPFLRKLEGKKQTKAQQQRTSRAITLYFDLLESKDMQTDGRSPRMVYPQGDIACESTYRPILFVNENKVPQTEPAPAAKTRETSSHSSFLPAGEPSSLTEARAPCSHSSQESHLEPTCEPVSCCESVSITKGASWREVFTMLAEEIQLRHYSPKP